jgi:UrcA family protein
MQEPKMMVLHAFLMVTSHLTQPPTPSLTHPRVDDAIEWGVTVPIDDLDLTDVADRKRLDRRIALVASKMCRNRSETTSPLEQAQCTTHAIEGVRAHREDLIARANTSKSGTVKSNVISQVTGD